MFSLSSQVKGGRKLSAQRGGGGIAKWSAFLLPDPVAPGSNSDSAEIFSLFCLVCGQYRDRTHLVLKQGISQMQLAVKAWAKFLKSFLPLELSKYLWTRTPLWRSWRWRWGRWCRWRRARWAAGWTRSGVSDATGWWRPSENGSFLVSLSIY